MRIRRAEADDAAALTALMKASAAYQGDYAGILANYAIDAAQIARDHIYLATDDAGRMMGFYSITIDPEPELDLMFVIDAAQGTGLGRDLFAHMRGVAAQIGIGEIIIVSHPPALGFYLRQGAVRVGTKAPTPTAAWERPILKLRVD
ncbi:GNAT family N-acetyltransferase [Sphingomonas crocodyli]|uniref:GNAT family N-acetyltransferase n=1 Tax=Sphingomonas crocodyli TaxID=1979270 RepID=A0A437MB02_9SPHN|nr:GNAT family N-acetyltransferase [Sphingomonas crocodyli]RVT94812.1 GNAT family N-acetyltransferase [Sphingomonas crocodyli]